MEKQFSTNGVNAFYFSPGIQERADCAPFFLVKAANEHGLTNLQFDSHKHLLHILDYNEIVEDLLNHPNYKKIIVDLITQCSQDPTQLAVIAAKHKIPCGELENWLTILYKTRMIYKGMKPIKLV